MRRRGFLRLSLGSLVGLKAWGYGTPLAWQAVWAQPMFAPDYPYPMASFFVQKANELREALASRADPGIHIVLMPGIYRGDFQVPRGGTASDPLVIRAHRPGTATIEGQLALQGDNTTVHGLELANDAEFAATLNGSGQKVMRSTFPGGRGIHVVPEASQYLIANNAFTGAPGPGEVADSIFLETSRPNYPDQGVIARNYFTDPDGGGQAEAHHIYLGRGLRDLEDDEIELLIAENLIEGSNRRRGIYLKGGGQIVNNRVDMKRGRNGFRNGRGGTFAGNVWQGGGDIVVNGPEHTITGNAWDGRMMVFCESMSPNDNIYLAADTAEMGDNIGDIELGYSAGSVKRKVKGVRVEQQTGEIRPWYEEHTQLLGGQASGRAAAENLTVASVGPNGPATDMPLPTNLRTVDPENGVIIPDDPTWQPEQYGQGYIKPETVRRAASPATPRPAAGGVKMHKAPKMPADIDKAMSGTGAAG